MLFTSDEYEFLHAQVFREGYAGYKPTVKEIPNGDGLVDADKRYAHIAPKYFSTSEERTLLTPYLLRAHDLAVEMGRLLQLPEAFMPDVRYGALRILDYPPGAHSHRHEDFDLFTVMCYRDQPQMFRSEEPPGPPGEALRKIRTLDPQAHLGQLGEAIGLGPATPHWVLPGDQRQRSIVYFAIPDHESLLPSFSTVRDWLNERMARSRTEFKKYE